MNVLVTGAFQLNSEELAALEAAGHKVFTHPDERAPVEQPERYEAVVCNGLLLHNPIERFTNLRLIQLTSAGLDRVPLDYIRAHDIELHNAAGVYSVPMAEFAVCGILQLYKQSRFLAANQAQHKWEKHRGLLELSGKRVCILGCGDVGREIAKRLKAFDCRITGVNRTVRALPDFDEVLSLDKLPDAAAVCDILICCIALTPETRGIVSKEIFDCLPAGAVFVNVARGALADEAALTAWLQSSGHAVLDVFEEEPLPEASSLWDMENVILTPHNSFVGDGNRARLWRCIQEALGLL
jgi:phosphoglycerate dehydrogenase-like enzyme